MTVRVPAAASGVTACSPYGPSPQERSCRSALRPTGAGDVRLAKHKAKMKAKRERRKTLVAGFTPVSNKRIDAAFAVAGLRAKLANPLLSPAEAERQGYRDVCATLPKARPFRHLFPRPSKNDSAAYRKAHS